jgi:hypothetical protein
MEVIKTVTLNLLDPARVKRENHAELKHAHH